MTVNLDNSRGAYIAPQTPGALDPTKGAQGKFPASEDLTGDLANVGQSKDPDNQPKFPNLSAAKKIPADQNSQALEDLTYFGGSVADMIAQMAAVMSVNTQKLRKLALEGKQAELKSQVTAMLGEAKKMASAADKNYNAALIQGFTQIASGTVGMVGSVKSYRMASQAGKDLKVDPGKSGAPTLEGKQNRAANRMGVNLDDEGGMAKTQTAQNRAANRKGVNLDEAKAAKAATDATPGSGNAETLLAQARGVTEASSAAGSIFTGVGGMLSAGQKVEADKLQAQAKELEAASTQAAANLAREDELAQTWKESFQRLMELVKAANEQEQSSSKSIIQNI